MDMENKKFTGRIFSPDEYKKFTKCVICGIVVKNKCKNNNCKDTDEPCESHYCEHCMLLKFDKCKVCSGIFHIKPIKSYTYDIREIKRDNGFEFKVSKVFIREFEYYKEPTTILKKDGICESCFGFENKIKNHCMICGDYFQNSRENYIKNGNMCEFQSFRFENIVSSMVLSLEVM